MRKRIYKVLLFGPVGLYSTGRKRTGIVCVGGVPIQISSVEVRTVLNEMVRSRGNGAECPLHYGRRPQRFSSRREYALSKLRKVNVTGSAQRKPGGVRPDASGIFPEIYVPLSGKMPTDKNCASGS